METVCRGNNLRRCGSEIRNDSSGIPDTGWGLRAPRATSPLTVSSVTVKGLPHPLQLRLKTRRVLPLSKRSSFLEIRASESPVGQLFLVERCSPGNGSSGAMTLQTRRR